MMLARSTPSIFLPAIMFAWGAMSIGAKGINSLGGMVAFRFFLGLVEAGFFPGVMLLMSCWYKPKELSKRIAAFYTAALMAGELSFCSAGGSPLCQVGSSPLATVSSLLRDLLSAGKLASIRRECLVGRVPIC